MKCYPELVKDPQDTSKYRSVQGLNDNVVNPALETTYQLIDDIFTDVAKLFPGDYVHVGGDERPAGSWSESPAVKKLIKEKGFKTYQEDKHLFDVQHYFFKRVEKILASKGKKMIGWEEIRFGGELGKDTAITSWQGVGPGIEAAKKGRYSVMAPCGSTYFDMSYNARPEEPGVRWAGTTSTEQAYRYNPAPNSLTADQAQFILGVQACLWSESFLELGKTADYLGYPRLSALAEVAWTPNAQKDWQGFQNRLYGKHFRRLDELGIGYRIPLPKATRKKGIVTIHKPHKYITVRYTLDGSEPTANSTEYKKPFKMADYQRLKMRSFNQYGRSSYTIQDIEAEKVATWKANEIKGTSFQELNIPSKELITSAGVYKFTFNYTHGGHALKIQSLKLYDGQKMIANDTHDGKSGGGKKNHHYVLTLKNFNARANYRLVATVAGDGGGNSNGDILLLKSGFICPEGKIVEQINVGNNSNLANAFDSSLSTHAWISTKFKTGETITYEFADFEKIKQISWSTGAGARDALAGGELHLSADGQNFTKVKDFVQGEVAIKFSTPRKVKAIRIKVTEEMKTWLILNDLIAN